MPASLSSCTKLVWCTLQEFAQRRHRLMTRLALNSQKSVHSSQRFQRGTQVRAMAGGTKLY